MTAARVDTAHRPEAASAAAVQVPDLAPVPVPARIVLALAGLTMLVIGVAGLVSPRAFHAANGIDLGPGNAVLNESRAAAGALVATGMLVALGAFLARLTGHAAVVGAAMYLGYALARLLSIAVDGAPGSSLTVAAVVELALGLACLLVLARRRQR